MKNKLRIVAIMLIVSLQVLIVGAQQGLNITGNLNVKKGQINANGAGVTNQFNYAYGGFLFALPANQTNWFAGIVGGATVSSLAASSTNLGNYLTHATAYKALSFKVDLAVLTGTNVVLGIASNGIVVFSASLAGDGATRQAFDTVHSFTANSNDIVNLYLWSSSATGSHAWTWAILEAVQN